MRDHNSGKTSLLTAIADSVSATNGLYLAYNRAIAQEAQKKFGSGVQCVTTHSLAYRSTVIPMKLKLGNFSYRSISEKIKYESKCSLVDHIRQFCLSEHLRFKDYCKEYGLDEKFCKLGNHYLSNMQTATIECTHDFYLKLFHIMLANGNITFPKDFDLVMLDEAGDLNAVTLEIFKLLPSAKKVMVGDPHQNIYSFNHTINAFDTMKNEGHTFPMTQSFRVSDHIASRIENFCQATMDPDFHFKGVPIEDKTISTRAFIGRTNASLIAKMIEFNEMGIQYALTRTAKQIFDLPLLLCSINSNTFITNPEYAFLKDDLDHYYDDPDLRKKFKTPLSYVLKLHKDDIAIQTAGNTIIKYGAKGVINCYEQARKHSKRNQSITLGTCHSCKGLEYDEVTILQDLNTSISDIYADLTSGSKTMDKLTQDELTELNLYYVAISRCRKSLVNAQWA